MHDGSLAHTYYARHTRVHDWSNRLHGKAKIVFITRMKFILVKINVFFQKRIGVKIRLDI